MPPHSSTETPVSRPRSDQRGPNQDAVADPPAWLELAKQVAFIVLGVLFYFGVRGMTEGSVSAALENGWRVLDFEAGMHLDIETTLQGWIRPSDALTTGVNWIYIWLHWPLIAITLLWLHHTHRLQYLQARNAMFVSGAIGLVIFARFPVAPPRLLDPRFVDTVTELSSSYRVLQPPGLVNKYAAIPSLHVGWNLLMGIAIYRSSTSLLPRLIAVASPALMAFAVIATANHYFIDGIIGAAVALLGLVIALAITKPLTRHDWLAGAPIASDEDQLEPVPAEPTVRESAPTKAKQLPPEVSDRLVIAPQAQA